jgi:multicomponent Na+:H+ antiporter subunit C
MEPVLAIVVGTLMACAVYLLLQRSLGQAIIGLALLANAVNLFIFVAAGVGEGPPPLVAVGDQRPPEGAADPVPQALILTAIVIGFGVLAFFITLCYRVYRLTGTDDLRRLAGPDRAGDHRIRSAADTAAQAASPTEEPR